MREEGGRHAGALWCRFAISGAVSFSHARETKSDRWMRYAMVVAWVVECGCLRGVWWREV